MTRRVPSVIVANPPSQSTRPAATPGHQNQHHEHRFDEGNHMQYRDEKTGNVVRDSRPEPEPTPRQASEATIRARNGGQIPARWAEMLDEEFGPAVGPTPSTVTLAFSDAGQGYRGTSPNPPVDVTRLKDHAYYTANKAAILDAIRTNTLN